MKKSPYEGLASSEWKEKTLELVDLHPIEPEVLVDAVLKSWELIYGSVIGETIIIGETYFPTPQILGDFLHELIPLELHEYNIDFRKGIGNLEKDIYCEEEFFSIEIKTSSQKEIYGNRSYAQKGTRIRKSKSGYYLAINFPPVHKLQKWQPITQIRFGWIDESDWLGQTSQTGQQARLSKEVLENKLITIYED